MVRPRHQPGGLCLLLLLLCQFMEDRSAQGKRGGMRWEMLDQLSESGMERSGQTKGRDILGPEAEFGARLSFKRKGSELESLSVVAAGYEMGRIKVNSLVKVNASCTCCVWVTGN
ncbi:hypothetical protein J1605_013633 [Eschrichtius robustus]|uniref:Uncharacterized protein n=1 Tax=Eschrichtius robustus TaxID=9764 RepID=A0AB34GI16_ESCRO|nr:hypothetical protein J1605_013633 [Eschrichtius robustus]